MKTHRDDWSPEPKCDGTCQTILLWSMLIALYWIFA